LSNHSKSIEVQHDAAQHRLQLPEGGAGLFRKMENAAQHF
jgi:hypothetical protein